MKLKYAQPIIICLLVSLLCQCTIPRSYDEGIVIGERQIPPTQKMMTQVKEDAVSVGKHGAIAGGILGAGLGGLIGMLESPAAGAAISSAVLIGGIGALTIGGFGLLAGSGIGLGRGYINSHATQYEYDIQSLSDQHIFSIQQYASPIPMHSKVKVFRQGDHLFIRKG